MATWPWPFFPDGHLCREVDLTSVTPVEGVRADHYEELVGPVVQGNCDLLRVVVAVAFPGLRESVHFLGRWDDV